MKSRHSILVFLLGMIATAAHAQVVDVRPFVVGDQIMTKGFVDATGQEIPDLRVFGYDFGEFEPPDEFFASDPGFNAAPGSGLPDGSQLLFNILDAAVFDLPSNLSYWDGEEPLELASWTSPGGVKLKLNFGGSNLVVGDATGLQPGFVIQTVQTNGVLHRHLSSFLDEGVPEPPAGIYLMPMELTSSDSAIQKSLPFFIVYNNGMSEAIHDEAIDWVQANLVLSIPGDFDGDGDVDGADFVVWQTNFPTATGATLATGDADGDGDVDGADFVVWQTNFPTTPSPSVATVPEPAGITLAVVAGLAGIAACWLRLRSTESRVRWSYDGGSK